MSAIRDFSTISPSARAILLVRSQTALPYARAAAELLFGADAVAGAAAEIAAVEGARLRRRHFELRALSLDQALDEVGATRILELAAGFSFRGLDRAVRAADVHYVDSDLADVIAAKRDLVAELCPTPPAGLRLVPLDALDRDAFHAALADLPAGPVAVVHEGLLMYLDDAEKERLAANVHAALAERGGWWITADVYVRGPMTVFRDARSEEFLARHQVEDRKFASWQDAETTFTRLGFKLARRAAPTGDLQHQRETWTLVV